MIVNSFIFFSPYISSKTSYRIALCQSNLLFSLWVYQDESKVRLVYCTEIQLSRMYATESELAKMRPKMLWEVLGWPDKHRVLALIMSSPAWRRDSLSVVDRHPDLGFSSVVMFKNLSLRDHYCAVLSSSSVAMMKYHVMCQITSYYLTKLTYSMTSWMTTIWPWLQTAKSEHWKGETNFWDNLIFYIKSYVCKPALSYVCCRVFSCVFYFNPVCLLSIFLLRHERDTTDE